MFSRQQKAFTLIELMVVLCIIAIIICIGVPMLLAARMAANEIAAIAAVKNIQEAQTLFQRSDYYQIGAVTYANFLDDLCVLPHNVPQLIAPNLALSRPQGNWWGAPPEPYQGYFFSEVSSYCTNNVWAPVSTSVPVHGVSVLVAQRYGVIAAPASYLVTGRMMFAGDDNGGLWKIDPQGDYDLTQHLPLGINIKGNGWMDYGQD